jgi:hypothetical protein
MNITVQPGDNAYFWPARGFKLTHIRLVRRLPEL